MTDLPDISCLADSVYTERYMGQPTSEDNERGYEVSSNFLKKSMVYHCADNKSS